MESFAADPSLARSLGGREHPDRPPSCPTSSTSGSRTRLPVDTRFLRVLLDQIEPAARPARRPTARPGARSSPSAGDPTADAGYFLSEDKSLLFVLVETAQGREGQLHGRPGRHRDDSRRGGAAAARSFRSVQAGVTGAPVLSNDEMTAAFERQPGRHRARLRPHPRASCSLAVRAGGQAAAHAGRARR